ncbi:helix-hairpin-helix domain-containing protein [Terrabacter sp. Soil811]|uniref:helix-hairpin-helix domain-containing protein n=1 Tax=Terrabacter sp. Soil811 TaxID=1736419 RepID=UPI0009EC0B86|nr:helix-hairpin-helix domain-containing protein [Terrabacter sp. Soil811]
MPFRPAQRPPDLERVARILGADTGRVGPGDDRARAAPAEGEEVGGWVPRAPGAAVGENPVASAVRRLTQRATDDDEVERLDADLRRARRPGVLTVPDELRTGRRGVSSAAVVSMLALVVAVGCVFVLRVLWAERSASPPDVAPGPSRSVQVVGGTATAAARMTTDPSTGAVSGAASGAPSGGPTSGAELVVHVVGQVVRPGLVRLRPGARVADALTAAGGTRTGADVAALNLARLVVDGEQIRVPRPGEPPAVGPEAGGAGGAGSSGAGGAGGAGTSGGSNGPVSLNAADAAALDTLPGVGPVLAQRIIDWRTEHGRFTSVDELGEVSGIGDKLMAQLRPKVTL